MTETNALTRQTERVAIRPPNLLLRIVWFVLIGWWLTGVLSAAAWALNASVVGLPLGLWIINRLPFVATLHPIETFYVIDDGHVISGVAQRPFIIRAIYFLLIGWWLSGLWMAVAYAFLISIIGLPIAFWMYGRIGAVTTLFRTQ